MKIIFFDIDGTLLDYDGRMPQSTREALALAKEKGHRLILCSGRNKCAVKQLMERFNFDGCVCSAGAYVEYHEQVVCEETFTDATLQRLIDFLEQDGASYGLQCKDYIACPDRMHEEYEKAFGTKAEEGTESPLADGEEEKLDDIGKSFVFVEDIRSVEKVQKAFETVNGLISSTGQYWYGKGNNQMQNKLQYSVHQIENFYLHMIKSD